MHRFNKATIQIVAAAGGAVLLAAVFYFGLSYIFYSAVENWVTSRLGFDFYPARLFATIIVISLTAVFPVLIWYLIFGKQRLHGALALIGIQAGVCLLVYTVGGNVCFDRRTGKPLCYFADTAQGRVWSRSPGFDPASGIRFKLYTREIMEIEERSKRSGK